MFKFTNYIILSIIFTFILSQENYFYNWNGLSVSNSDNLDAINLNPAGLGYKRAEQFGFAIKQFPHNSEDINFLAISKRYEGGFAMETTYYEEFKTSIAYGFPIYENVYLGFKYHEDSDYSLGTLIRPHNAVSLGYTKFTNDNSLYDYDRYGIAIKPFSFFNSYDTINNGKFSQFSNLTIGFDRTKDKLTNQNQEQFFISFAVTHGLNISYHSLKYDKNNDAGTPDNTDDDYIEKNINSYGINLSFNIGNQGLAINTEPTNNFYRNLNDSSSFALQYYNYNQKMQSIDLENIYNKERVTYIKMKLEGLFIEEQPTTSPFDFLDINPLPFTSSPQKGQQLKQWIDYVNNLTEDDSVHGLIIELGNVRAGIAKKKEMHSALLNFKNSGKKIIVYSRNYISNSNYYLISMADEIYTHRMAEINLSGINMEMTFLRGLLDTLSIVPEVIRVSPYKTAADPILNRKMSDEMRENYTELSNDIYNSMVKDISIAKNISTNETIMMIDKGPYLNTLRAIEENVITGVMFPDEFDDYINNINNENIRIIKTENHRYTNNYEYNWVPEEKPKIAIIYAVGGIVSGESNPGPSGSSLMGHKTISEAIKNAREDEDIEAIVLRIDSGGGSAIASDLMWKEVYNTTVEDSSNIKPFIVSMSDVAASGGYYIACQADSIIADETTITGSIGVIYGRLNFSKLLERIGINSENIQNGQNADFASSSRLFTDEEKEKLYESIIDVYNIFKQRVVDGRDNLDDIEALDEVALGRVWTGSKALEKGLVDKIGGLHDAINVAKNASNINTEDDVEIVEYPEVKSFSFFNVFDNNSKFKVKKLSYHDFFPKELADELDALEIIPVIQNDKIQLLMPYKINIE